MTRGNTYTCVVCGQKHEYCPRCNITHPNYDATRFCSKAHADIFNILSKHGCNLATAEETLEALKPYDLTSLNEDIQAHIDSLKPAKVEVKVETKPEVKTEVKAETKVEAKAEVKKEPENHNKWKFRGQE